ncbi:MAG: sugar transferase [Patescibacteria group bacterium]
MKRSEVFINIALVFVDVVMILAGFVVAYQVRIYGFDFVPVQWVLPLADYFKYILLFIPLWVGVFALMGLYAFRGIASFIREASKVIIAASAMISLMIMIIFFNRDQFFSRLIIIYAWLFVIFFLIAGRFLLRTLQRFLYRYGVGVRRVVMVGVNEIALELIDYLDQNRKLGWELVGVIDEEKQKGEKVAGYRVLGNLERLGKINKRYGLDEVWIAKARNNEEQMLEIIQFCHDHDLTLRLVPSILEVVSANVETRTVAGIPLLALRETALEGWGRIMKRVFDIVFSVLVLLTLWPVYLLIAIAVKLDSPGPVFYTSTRVGRKGKNFTIYKFRSMRSDLSVGDGFGGREAERLLAELKQNNEAEGPMFKLKDDPRITRVGKFIRMTRLDELAQIINVIKGEMSWIGPRPPLPEEVMQYKSHQLKRLAIKSGITGPWQVTGRHDLTFDEIVKLDTYYIEHWSLSLDFQIFFKTIWLMLTRAGR